MLWYLQRALLLRFVSRGWSRADLKICKYILSSFMLLSPDRYRSVHYRGLRQALLFSSGIILVFDICESWTFGLFSTSHPRALWLLSRPAPGAMSNVSSSLLSSHCSRIENFRRHIFFGRQPDIGVAVRVFANGPGDLGSISGRVISKTQKMVLDASLLNTQHYKVRIKGKVEQSWERSSALPYTLV